MEEITFKTEVFEGPLDLLLHLIAVHKLDIYDINISELVDQYISYIKSMKENNLDIASDFIAMASRLVYIKTVSLLPKKEEAEKLKEELTGELIEYRDLKICAEKLAGMTEGFDKLQREPADIKADMTYRRFHDSAELVYAYLNAVGKKLRKLPPPEDSFKEIVEKAVVSVSSRVKYIYKLISMTGKVSLDDVYYSSATRSELVASFLAVLEMSRKGIISLSGSDNDVYMEIGSGDIENAAAEFDEF